jgi:hypothetical protein
MAATVANLTLVANKTEQRGSEGNPSLSLSSRILAFGKSIWNHLSHLELNLTSTGGQKPAPAFRRGADLLQLRTTLSPLDWRGLQPAMWQRDSAM